MRKISTSPTVDIIMYNTEDIMNIFRCGKRQAYELMHAPGFPAITIGKRIFVEKKQLLKWIENNQGKTILM